MQLKWCLVAVIFDFLTAIQRVRDQLLYHFCREFPISDVETKISVCRTPHILNKKRNQPIPTDNDGQHLIFSLSLTLKHQCFQSHDTDLCIYI